MLPEGEEGKKRRNVGEGLLVLGLVEVESDTFRVEWRALGKPEKLARTCIWDGRVYGRFSSGPPGPSLVSKVQ